jgi:hypothetical protein
MVHDYLGGGAPCEHGSGVSLHSDGGPRKTVASTQSAKFRRCLTRVNPPSLALSHFEHNFIKVGD